MQSWLDILPGEDVNGVLLITPVAERGGVDLEELHHQTNHWRTYLAKTETRMLVFDLKKSDYLGSEFIGALIAILNECERLGGRAAICRISEHMTGVLNAVRPLKSLGLFDTLEMGFAYVLGQLGTGDAAPAAAPVA